MPTAERVDKGIFKPCIDNWLKFVQLKVVIKSTEVTTHADPGLDHSSKQLLSSSLVWNQQWQITTSWTHSSGLQISRQQQSWCACAPEPSGGNEKGVDLTSQGDPSQQLWSTCQLGDHNLVSADSNSSREGKHVTSGFTGAQELHWTGSTLEWRIQFHKMQKGKLTAHHCQKWRGFSPSSRHVLLPLTCAGSGSHKTPLWTSPTGYTPSGKKLTVFFWVREEMSTAVSRKGYVKQSDNTEGERIKVKPSPPSAAAGTPPQTPQQHTGNHTARNNTAKDPCDPLRLLM